MKLIMWRLFHLRIVGRSNLSCTKQFVCLKSSEKFEKRIREDESLFTMTIRALHIYSNPRLFDWRKGPNLAPNDFFLFPHIKKEMRGQRFSSPEDAVEAFKNHVLEVFQSEWRKCFDKWFKRKLKVHKSC